MANATDGGQSSEWFPSVRNLRRSEGLAMLHKLKSRINLLEVRFIPKQVDSVVFVSHPISEEVRRNLEPGERIVLDYFRHQGLLIDASERITTDPRDHGRRCEPGGILEDVLRKLHENCYFRNCGGWCRTCANTPVANT